MSVKTGIEVLRLREYEPLTGKRVGLLTNPSAVTRDLTQTIDLFRARHPNQFTLSAIFTPEHGFAAAVDGGETVESTVDPISGASVFSLYGETFAPTSKMLEHVNVIVCDIQDIGVRYYTYAWTISHILEAAGVAKIPVIILDRPNPLGCVTGYAVDGAILNMQFASLVGRAPIPTQHDMTMGELMRMFNKEWNPNPCDLSVIQCGEYHRTMTWEQTGLTFVPPSPNMTHLSTVRHYPGACLVEGTNLSEGRGTSLPFEIAGAPFIDENRLAVHLNALGMAGVHFRPHVFKPTANKFAGQVCRGIQAHTVGTGYRSMLVWMHVIRAVYELYPQDFSWRPGAFDRLYGSDAGRAFIESGKPLEELAAIWDADAALFREQRKPYLIYAS